MAWGFRNTLGSVLSIAAIYDRDYRCDEETISLKMRLEKEVKFAHFHQRKEIENYLLEPKVLERAARKAVEERARRTGAVVTVDFDIVGMLEAITTTLKSECSGQYVGKYSAYVKAGGKDPATLATEALTIFEKKWSALESRLEIVPGKDVLRSVRDRLQESHEITLTDWRIIDCYKAEEVPHDLAALLRRLDAFRSGREEG